MAAVQWVYAAMFSLNTNYIIISRTFPWQQLQGRNISTENMQNLESLSGSGVVGD